MESQGWFVAPDDAHIFWRLWRPETSPKAVLLGLHDLETHSGWLAPLGSPLARRGVAFCAVDLRGNGRSGPVRGDAPGESAILADLYRISVRLEEELAAPIFLFGQGLGGAWTLRFASACPERLDGIVLANPATPEYTPPVPLGDYLKFPLFQLISPDRPVLTLPKRSPERLEVLFRLEEFRQEARKDRLWLHRISPRYALMVDTIRREVERFAREVTLPVLVLAGEAAPGVEGARRVFAALGSAAKEFRAIPDAPQMLLQDPAAKQVVDRVGAWIDKQLRERRTRKSP